MRPQRLPLAFLAAALLSFPASDSAARDLPKEPSFACGRAVTIQGTLHRRLAKDLKGNLWSYESVVLSGPITVTGCGEPETGVRVMLLVLDARTMPLFRHNVDLRISMSGVLSSASDSPLDATRKFTRVLFAPSSFTR